MADVTISSLPLGTPSGNLVLPISDGSNTYKAPLSDIQVNYNSLTNKPTIPTVINSAQLTKAWVSFDATRQANGSPVTGNQYLYIRSSYNVSGVFRVGSGQYQVYFINPISGDYCVTGTSEHYRGSNAAIVYIDRVPVNGLPPINTTYCTINTLSYTGAAYDSAAYVSVLINGA